MPFRIHMGVPEMEAFWNDLSSRKLQNQLSGEEEKFFKKLIKKFNNCKMVMIAVYLFIYGGEEFNVLVAHIEVLIQL